MKGVQVSVTNPYGKKTWKSIPKREYSQIYVWKSSKSALLELSRVWQSTIVEVIDRVVKEAMEREEK